ncbi:hypothetical protein I4U23_006467 [Adineta vaga]|nr:hypothetical protein I4U23_006467 [Adineta vaga]
MTNNKSNVSTDTDDRRDITLLRNRNGLLVWLDKTININDTDCQHTINQLQQVISNIDMFIDENECVEFLETITNNKACIILSGSLGQHIVPCVHDKSQVDSIFIFCKNKTYHKEWVKKWPKIKGVYTSITPISAGNPDLVGILFVMTIDPTQSTTPFASIRDVSYFKNEDEILFSMHSVFRVDDITPMDETNRIYQINLTATSDDDKDLCVLTQCIRDELCPDTDGWFRLGLLLRNMGQFDRAKEVYEVLFEQTTDESEKASIYYELGTIKYDQVRKIQLLISRTYDMIDQIPTDIRPIFSECVSDTYNLTRMQYTITLNEAEITRIPEIKGQLKQATTVEQQRNAMNKTDRIVADITLNVVKPSFSFLTEILDFDVQSALTTTTASITGIDVKPIILQSSDNIESHQPNKRLALDSSDLHNSSITFSTVPKSDVLTSLQQNTLSLATVISQSSTSSTPYSTLRLVTPSTFINPNEISTIQTSGQQLLLQQHGNIVITQPVVTLQLQQDPNLTQKENQTNAVLFTTDQSQSNIRTSNADYLPVQYQRKPCNCTKSMCLKLYCDCFANGLNCQNCACLNCHNDVRHEEERTKAINTTLERNPNAFKSKMYKFANTTVTQPDRPLKGCNCKKSSCHKRYCECYESRVPCTSLCKCIGCKNTEQSIHPLNVGFYRSGQPKTTTQTPLDQIPRTGPPTETTTPNNVFNMEVTEALATCLLVTGQQCEMNQTNTLDTQHIILKEFQRCMHQIVRSALGRPHIDNAFQDNDYVSKEINTKYIDNFATDFIEFRAAKSGEQTETKTNYEYILVDIKGQKSNVAVVQLNRPKAFNSLCNKLMTELTKVLNLLDKDDKIACIVLTGGMRAFSIGADIKEMQLETMSQIIKSDFPNQLSVVSRLRKPIIAAVNGFALGGGCELSMMCDIIYAGHKAEFSQPEVTIGTIPGAGGTQRLSHFVGKSKAMEMILTGNRMNAEEAERIGLVSAVFPAEELVEEAIKTAEKIGNHSKIVVQLAKEAVNAAFETTLAEGIRLEKTLSYMTFGLTDRKEGMTAFIEKRQPNFTDQ